MANVPRAADGLRTRPADDGGALVSTAEPGRGGLYRRWIAANGWAEALGLGTTFVVARAAAPALGEVDRLLPALAAGALAILLGALLEGVLVGVAQERVLRQYFTGLRRHAWTLATTVGAALAWLIGMIPSTVMAVRGSPAAGDASTASEPGLLVQLGLAALLGLAVGPILGSVQWIVLRRFVEAPARWLWANGLAWALGMPIIFAGMDRVPWNGPLPAQFLAIYVVCAAAGVAVGIVHGGFLVRFRPLSGVRSLRVVE